VTPSSPGSLSSQITLAYRWAEEYPGWTLNFPQELKAKIDPPSSADLRVPSRKKNVTVIKSSITSLKRRTVRPHGGRWDKASQLDSHVTEEGAATALRCHRDCFRRLNCGTFYLVELSSIQLLPVRRVGFKLIDEYQCSELWRWCWSIREKMSKIMERDSEVVSQACGLEWPSWPARSEVIVVKCTSDSSDSFETCYIHKMSNGSFLMT